MNGPPEKRAALKHWLRERLTKGEGPKQDWGRLLDATWDHLLLTPVHDLVDPGAIEALCDRLADPRHVTELTRPIATAVARAAIDELRTDDQPLDRFVPGEARERLYAILGRPGLVHPDWVRAVFRGEAVEALLNETLYRALTDFSTFIPRLMIRLSPMGRFGVMGGARAFAERLIREFEKALEPEVRSFLADSTKRVLEHAAEFAIAKLDEPASIEFRRDLAAFMMSRSPAFYLQGVDDALVEEIETVAELIACNLVSMPEVRTGVRVWIDKGMTYAAGKTLGELLRIEGTGTRPPLDEWAEATWPPVKAVLGSPEAQRQIDSLLDELLDEYERD